MLTSARPKLHHKHYRAALLAAAGKSVADIAQDLDMSAATVRKWFREPLIEELIAQYRQQMFAGVAKSLEESLVVDAPNTFQVLKDLRDGGSTDKIKLGACATLWDRQVPKKTVVEEDRTVRILISQDDGRRCQQVMQEMRLLPTAGEELPDAFGHAATDGHGD